MPYPLPAPFAPALLALPPLLPPAPPLAPPLPPCHYCLAYPNALLTAYLLPLEPPLYLPANAACRLGWCCCVCSTVVRFD